MMCTAGQIDFETNPVRLSTVKLLAFERKKKAIRQCTGLGIYWDITKYKRTIKTSFYSYLIGFYRFLSLHSPTGPGINIESIESEVNVRIDTMSGM